jgi:phage shock protein E
MQSLKEIIKQPETIIVDVRSPWEYDMEHVPGARNIPLEEIMNKMKEIKELKGPIVLYCRSGNRSGMAAGLLKQKGITEVYNGGGLDDMQFLLN